MSDVERETPMIEWLLIGRDGGLRAGLRLALHLVMVVWTLLGGILIVASAAAALMFAANGPPDMLVGLWLQGFVLGSALILATAGSAWVLDARWVGAVRPGRLSDAAHGVQPARGLVEGVLGVLLAALAMAITVGIMALGGMEASLGDLSLSRAPIWLITGLALVLAAWFEELLFRGYAYQWLAGSLARLGHALLGGRRGVLAGLVDVIAFAGPAGLLSVAFGLMHLSNPSATWLSTANTVLAGVWFTVILLRTRSLWPAITAHWAWNALTVLILGLPVSGVSEASGFDIPSLFHLSATGPEWLSGGAYGPEGSVGCIVGLLAAIVLSAVLPRRRPEQGFAAARRLPAAPETP